MKDVHVEKKIVYRDIRRYKYQLLDDYVITIGIRPTGEILEPPPPLETYVRLGTEGKLSIARFYAWDGPSGPSIDTRDFMRGSLVHDALYQLIRAGRIPESSRDYADALLRDICIEDGMSRFRAWYVHGAVRLFAGGAAKPGRRDDFIVRTAP